MLWNLCLWYKIDVHGKTWTNLIPLDIELNFIQIIKSENGKAKDKIWIVNISKGYTDS